MSCTFCSVALHSTCSKKKDGKCCCYEDEDKNERSSEPRFELDEDGSFETYDESRPKRRGKNRSKRRDANLRDQQSTGRKRAAVAYPLDRTAPCEWQGLKCAGGDRFPIVGCIDGLQQARHHGPDKNTLNNDEGNVHRICHNCHNRWHTLNDSGYVWDGFHTAHDSDTKASVEEQMMNELRWAGKPLVKARD